MDIVATKVEGLVLEDLISNLPQNIITDKLFSGDRLGEIEFGTTVFLSDDKFAGLVTVAMTSDTNSPTRNRAIAGIYVFPEYRRLGYGKAMMKLAIELCVQQSLVPIHIDSMSGAILAFIESLGSEFLQYLDRTSFDRTID
ncbi:MAG: GNAT family N-acetyltransferase [Oscillatoriaceae cyanobacterium Prado104]|jgi:GNAT superfamily N-acetyltransferase|nr:GNAT family N-acetyltransferase [Oscillatoriaceae cyanobacterium Prado104]